MLNSQQVQMEIMFLAKSLIQNKNQKKKFNFYPETLTLFTNNSEQKQKETFKNVELPTSTDGDCVSG